MNYQYQSHEAARLVVELAKAHNMLDSSATIKANTAKDAIADTIVELLKAVAEPALDIEGIPALRQKYQPISAEEQTKKPAMLLDYDTPAKTISAASTGI